MRLTPDDYRRMMRRLEAIPSVYVEICRVQQDNFGNRTEKWAVQIVSAEEGASRTEGPPGNKLVDLSEQELATILALRDGGYIEISSAGDGPYFDPDDLEVKFARITMSGHEFLAVTRANPVWEKTKATAAEVGGMTLRMIIETSVNYLKEEIRSRGFPIP